MDFMLILLFQLRFKIMHYRTQRSEQTYRNKGIVFSFFHPTDDKTRVVIGENQEYINASYIRMHVGAEEFLYISCQGPLPSTVQAFWQMIWENKSDVISMMTQEVERGRIKCHKYWPDKMGVPLDTGRHQVHLENQQFLEYFHIKVIRVVEIEVRQEYCYYYYFALNVKMMSFIQKK